MPRVAHLLRAEDLESSTASIIEATRLAGFDIAEARRFFGRPPLVSVSLERDYLKPWPAETAEARYLERFARLFVESAPPPQPMKVNKKAGDLPA